MNEKALTVLGLTAGWGVIYWVWRNLFRGAGLSILFICWITYGAFYLFLPTQQTTILLVILAAGLIFSIMRIAISPKYNPINPTFETNQVLRGLTPIETGFLLGFQPDQVLAVGLVTLADKDIVRFKSTEPSAIKINSDYINPGLLLSAEGRRQFREKAALEKNLVLTSYEHRLIELILSDEIRVVRDINTEIWFNAVRDSLLNLGAGYDLERTREYASCVLAKMASAGSDFASGRSDLSGWYAARFFAAANEQSKIPTSIADLNEMDPGGPIKNHRPVWLDPGDDFEDFITQLAAI